MSKYTNIPQAPTQDMVNSVVESATERYNKAYELEFETISPQDNVLRAVYLDSSKKDMTIIICVIITLVCLWFYFGNETQKYLYHQ